MKRWLWSWAGAGTDDVEKAPEQIVLLFLCIGVALFYGEGELHLGRGGGKLFGAVVGLVLFGAAHGLVHALRRRWPGLLVAGPGGSTVRFVVRWVSGVLVGLFGVALVLGVVGFLVMVPVALIWVLTGSRTISVVLGVAVSPLLVWGYHRLVSPRRTRPPVRPPVEHPAGVAAPTGSGATAPGSPPRPAGARPAVTDASGDDPDAADDPVVYQATFGGWRGLLLPGLGSVAFLAVGYWLTVADSTVMGVLSLGLGGAGLVAVVVMAARRGVALRVDAFGMALGWKPTGGTVPGRVAPWADITAVVLFEQITGSRPVDYVGLVRRAGLPPLPGGPGARMLGMSAALIPGVPAEVLAASVPVTGWGLDEARLAAAIAHNAPEVQLVDLRR